MKSKEEGEYLKTLVTYLEGQKRWGKTGLWEDSFINAMDTVHSIGICDYHSQLFMETCLHSYELEAGIDIKTDKIGNIISPKK